MKKYLLALSLFCIVAVSARAQKVTPGIKGGLNISDVAGINGDNRLSGHVGLFLHSRLSNYWAIQPEILYSGQGQQFIFLNHEYTLALSYIQIPVMFQFYPVKQFYIEFGPQIGFLLSAKHKDDGEETDEVDENYKKSDVAISFGAGFQVTRMLGFYARYNAGLSDIYKNNPDYYNRVGQIGVAIKFK